jgi:multidrug efflux system membrane fusion protein
MLLRTSVVATACAFALTCTQNPAGQKPARGVAVKAVAVVQRDVPIEVRAVGRIVSSQSVALRPEVSGRILAVHFVDGQTVRTGDLLLEIDPRPYRAVLAQAKAKLAQDRARAENARADATRYADLLENRLVADQEHAAAAAEADALEAAVAGDQAAVDRATLDLVRCSIRAPIEGRTGRLLVHVGNTVSANSAEPLLTIEKRRPVYAEFSIPERHLAALRSNGQTASPAVVHTEGDLERKGTLSFIDNAVDPATGTILLRVQLANDDEALWPGQIVEVRLRLELRTGAKVVPGSAVAQGQQGDYAYVVTRKKIAEMRPVVVEPAGDNEFIVTRGLSTGELVVTEGQIKLTPGAKIEIVGDKD